MGYLRSEEEVEAMIEEMKKKTKGKYITQGITFSKDSERQMELLKYALMYSTSFSGLGKELIADKFKSELSKNKIKNNNSQPSKETYNNYTEVVEKKDTGNFLL
ncbi:hypothetical protein [Lysinibacillus sp. Bpr_S20]|uniref:hypothetical protein n=1 Tax=Lysinibacillus sp. Bpr_S20 TaxID=2933964 RepID=UPI002011DF2B|nr:hypothetical protein [Lysinibacillus sp. Bpr_S20]MCL1700865.1 hypothetical protein [Lysinibacillus sp. Bpr_S20]